MLNILQLAFRVSRPRFWLYLGGTYLVGFIIGMVNPVQLLHPVFVLHIVFFLLPANVFLYGVNDYYDEDTDIFNPKKEDKEYRITAKDKRNLQVLIISSFIYGLLLFFLQPNFIAQLILGVFLLLSFLYSAKPIRFKARPFLDFMSNCLYVLPALLAFYQTRLYLPALLPVFAAFLWTSAMHLFSAIPDIEADTQAGITTTAVLIGFLPSLILCFSFWLLFAIILVFVTPWNLPWSILTFVYPVVPLLLLLRSKIEINRVYWMFPYWNAIFGLLLFFSIGIPKLVIL